MTQQDLDLRRMTRDPDHETSERAARGVKRETLRALVLRMAENWPEGFTDEEMDAQCRRHEPDLDRPESSYRKRRTELADDYVIVDTGQERPKRNGQLAKVWVHRKFHPDPPPAIVKPRGRAAVALARSRHADVMWNALVTVAPHHQGGHSETGRAIAEALGMPFPIRMTEIPAKRPV